MSKPYDFLVFIGRFQPFHNGHKKVIDRALELADRVIILIGSSFEARSHRNPFSYDERKDMILATYRQQRTFNRDFHRILTQPIVDHLYDDTSWSESIQSTVQKTIDGVEVENYHNKEPVIGLIGHSKDKSSYYLSMFPQWKSENVPGYDDKRLLDSTWIRKLYFAEKDSSEICDLVLPAVVPDGTMDYLNYFRENTINFQWLVDEHKYIRAYQQQWSGTPYPVTFVTTDAVVVQSAHVLLVKRRASPGKGLWALPGGFLNQDESLQDGMLRELEEETRIKVAERTLRGSIARFEVFDAPNRSARGRVITNAFLIHLEPRPKLPKVRGDSDAEYAMWVPKAELKLNQLFEDHYHIIQKMTAGL